MHLIHAICHAPIAMVIVRVIVLEVIISLASTVRIIAGVVCLDYSADQVL
jgi:hypothetical protein